DLRLRHQREPVELAHHHPHGVGPDDEPGVHVQRALAKLRLHGRDPAERGGDEPEDDDRPAQPRPAALAAGRTSFFPRTRGVMMATMTSPPSRDAAAAE